MPSHRSQSRIVLVNHIFRCTSMTDLFNISLPYQDTLPSKNTRQEMQRCMASDISTQLQIPTYFFLEWARSTTKINKLYRYSRGAHNPCWFSYSYLSTNRARDTGHSLKNMQNDFENSLTNAFLITRSLSPFKRYQFS